MNRRKPKARLALNCRLMERPQRLAAAAAVKGISVRRIGAGPGASPPIGHKTTSGVPPRSRQSASVWLTTIAFLITLVWICNWRKALI